MIAVVHRIAGITFRTESTVWLPRLQEEPFERFRVGDDVLPDVRQRVHKLVADPLTQKPLSAEEHERLWRGACLELEGPAGSLLHTSAVQARINAVREQSEQVSISGDQDHVIVRDFVNRTLDFFYTQEYGGRGEDIPPEERLYVGNGSLAAERFRIHQVQPDSLAVSPLTTTEQEQVARIAEFAPQLITQIPLLRSPEVRATMQPGLDGAVGMKVFLYLDGLMVWNLAQDTIDYFYPAGGGRSRCDPENRVAVNFRHMFSTFLPQFSAIMVHSSGMIRGGRAMLFLAPDAGGKTTVLSLASGGLLLSDDQVVVREEGGDIVAHATPLGQMTSGPCQAPLGALFVLEKAPHFELSPIKPAELVKVLWDEHEVYTTILPKQLKTRTFDLFYDACHRVPTYRMHFPKDYVDWGAIDAALAVG